MVEEATDSVSAEPDVVELKIVSEEEQGAEMIEAQVAEEATVSAPAAAE